MPVPVSTFYKFIISLNAKSIPFYFKTKQEADSFKKNYSDAVGEMISVLAVQENQSSKHREIILTKEMQEEKTTIPFGSKKREIDLIKRYQLMPRLKSEVEQSANLGAVFPIEIVRANAVTYFATSTAKVNTVKYDLADKSNANATLVYVKDDKRWFVKMGEELEFEDSKMSEMTKGFFDRIKQKLESLEMRESSNRLRKNL